MAELVFRAESGQREKRLKEIDDVWEKAKKVWGITSYTDLEVKIATLEAQINNLEGQIAAYQNCIEKILRKN